MVNHDLKDQPQIFNNVLRKTYYRIKSQTWYVELYTSSLIAKIYLAVNGRQLSESLHHFIRSLDSYYGIGPLDRGICIEIEIF